MEELLPIALGALVAAAILRLPSQAWRRGLLPFGCVAAGIVASVVNGETASDAWALFFSADALLAWAGGAGMAVMLSLARRYAAIGAARR